MQKSTRDKILDSTLALLWQQSYGAMSVDDICHVAKVQKGSFYHYFPSKLDVVIAAFDKMWEDNRHIVDGIFSASLPPLERLELYCDWSYQKQKEGFDKYGKVLGCPYMSLSTELVNQEERIRTKMTECFTRSAKYFESLLRDAQAAGLTSITDPVTTAEEMLAFGAGVIYQAMLKNDLEMLRRDLKTGLMRYFDTAPAAKMKKTDQSVKSRPLVHSHA